MYLQLFHIHYGISERMLPDQGDGKYILSYTDLEGERHPLIELEGLGDMWQMYSTTTGILLDRDQPVEQCELRCNESYRIMAAGLPENDNIFFLLSQPVSQQVRLLTLPAHDLISVGFEYCDITYPLDLLCSTQVLLSIEGGRATLKDDNGAESNGTFVNGKCVTSRQLQVGDVIDLFGLRMVYLGKSLAINSPHIPVTIHERLLGTLPEAPKAKARNGGIQRSESFERRFDRSPRIYREVKPLEMEVDAPPTQEVRNEQPLLLTMGSSLTMSMSSIMMAFISLQNVQTNGGSIMSALPSLVMAGGMLMSSMVFPFATRKYTEHKSQKNEEKRISKYSAYLDDVERKIHEASVLQREEQLKTAPDVQESYTRVMEMLPNLWERTPYHADFLSLRLGLATLPVNAKIRFPSAHFSMTEDRMKQRLDSLAEQQWLVEGMPLTVSLLDMRIIGIIGHYAERMHYLQRMLVQLTALHSYQDLKLAFLYDAAEADAWEFVRWFPHGWDDEGNFRAIAASGDGISALGTYLEKFMTRGEDAPTAHCILIAASKELLEQCGDIADHLEELPQTHLSVIALAGRASELPRECHSVVTVSEQQGLLYRNIAKSDSEPVAFQVDKAIDEEQVRQLAIGLNRTHLSEGKENVLPSMLTFYAMMRCGRVDQLQVRNRWAISNPIKSLAAPIGVDKYGSPVLLDIHEKAHGPHGLIAGTTGSGKSEFIITYLLSLAAHYSPLEVNFILIDYKGGGMSETLRKLPHVVGTITNLGGRQGIHRAMVSIKSEVQRRQQVFSELQMKRGISSPNIYQYQAMYRKHEVSEPMSHLIIVSDEFAELKQQEQEFMDDLISISRIGRSLGIHLILATQKPSGVVNEQIVGNTRFRVCLKVQDRSDSMQMLGRPEASTLVNTGRFYLQVGSNELFVLGQSAWSGAPDTDLPYYRKQPDTSLEILNDYGSAVLKQQPTGRRENESGLKQVSAVTEHIAEEAEKLSVIPAQIWLPPLDPDEITLSWLAETYPAEIHPEQMEAVIDMVDDPAQQRQYPLKINLSDGNILLYAMPNSGENEFIAAMVASLCEHHGPDMLNIYCLDYAAEAGRLFASLPQVGDVIVGGEDEKFQNFIKWLNQEISRRRKVLADYAGDIQLYRSASGSTMPDLLIIINNYAALQETYEDEAALLHQLMREGTRFHMYFMVAVTTSTTMRIRDTQNFTQKYCLQLADSGSYFDVLGRTEGMEPCSRVGSGIFRDERILEFQVAKMADTTNEVHAAFIEMSRRVAEQYPEQRAPRVRVLPPFVSVADLTAAPEKIPMNRVPIGISRTTMMPVEWNLKENFANVILYRDRPKFPFVERLTEMLALCPERKVTVLDLGQTLNIKSERVQVVHDKEACMNIINELQRTNLARNNAYKTALMKGEPTPTFSEEVYIICGYKNLMEAIKESNQTTASMQVVLLRGSANYALHLILVEESANVNGSLRMEEWYRRSCVRNGLWLGKGCSWQSALEIEGKVAEMDGAFGCLVHQGEPTSCLMLTNA